MWRHRTPRQEPGRPIRAATLNRAAEAAEWGNRLMVDAPLALVATGFGPLLRYAGQIFGMYVAVVQTGGITARSSSPPGSGIVTLYTWDKSTTTLASLGINKTIYNWNSTGGTIAAGKYCVIMRWLSDYWVIAAEC